MSRMVAVGSAMVTSALLFISPLAMADLAPFTGHWKGRGVYQLEGKQTNCAEVDFGFSADGKMIEFTFGSRSCDEHKETFDRVVVDYENGKLMFAGTQVGTYKDGLFSIAFSAPNGDGRTRHWRMTMRAEGDTLVYEESRRIDSNSTPMISFAGLMKKQ